MTSALDDMCGKTGDVADHSATKRDDMVASFDMMVEQPIGQPLKLTPALGTFSGRQDELRRFHPLQTGDELRPDTVCDLFVGHHQRPPPACKRHQKIGRPRQQADLDMDIIRTLSEIYGNAGHWAKAFNIISTVRPCGDVSLRMCSSASA